MKAFSRFNHIFHVLENGKTLLQQYPEKRVDWRRVVFPANFRFNMAELMADSSEISSQNEDNSVVQDEDQRARLTQFPQTRVRNMMKIDPDLHLANRESVFLLTRAAVSEFLYDSKDVSHNSK